ncbi:hypothetical protein [Nostoc sp. 'Peltigera membranacea cyanobiont' 210A]|nr:hypothetical protein [Nostoc sp. 'Peltigera membranacea cyanobiont' 210A]
MSREQAQEFLLMLYKQMIRPLAVMRSLTCNEGVAISFVADTPRKQ